MMRTYTIQINDYFARKAIGLSASRRVSDAPLGRWFDRARGDDSLPSKEAQAELRAAWRLGVVKDIVSSADGYEWSVDGSRLVQLADGAGAQAAEQLAATLAVAVELLGGKGYLVRLDIDGSLAQYIEVYSTTYNAHLAKSLGATLVEPEAGLESPEHINDDILTTIWQNARILVEKHGLRRSVRVVVSQQEEASMEKNRVKRVVEPAPAVGLLKADGHLTVWRFAQASEAYRLEWLLEVTAGQPTRLICAFAQGNESQRAVIETAVTLLNSVLVTNGAEEVARHALTADGGFFGNETPLADFALAFAEAFLGKEQREKLTPTGAVDGQTDLLQTIEGIRCERCQSQVEQFGDYAICMSCGDAQFVH